MPLQEYDILSGQNFSFTGTHPEKFHKIGALKNFAKVTEKHYSWSLFFENVTG